MKHAFNILKNLLDTGEGHKPSKSNIRHLPPRIANLVKPEIPEEKISARAFKIWQERGCLHGNDAEDWLLAKFQLEDELN